MQTQTIIELAEIYASKFYQIEKNDKKIWVIPLKSENAEEQELLDNLTELIRECHEGCSPDDFIYDNVHTFLTDIGNLDYDDTEDVDRAFIRDAITIKADSYTSDLLAWSVRHYQYCDEYYSEMGITEYQGFSTILATGNWYHKDRIYSILLDQLEYFFEPIESE